MAKGLGLIGNFRGKFGNAVGYNLKDSNNKQTQGIRIYQPIVKNPKTYAQAEQRARLAPINATYRLLKSVIDRGQEGIAYGNKSRLAWLKTAMKSFNGGWFEKGAVVNFPALVPISKGSLSAGLKYSMPDAEQLTLQVTAEEKENPTIGDLSTAVLAKYPNVKVGDQLTFIMVSRLQGSLNATVISFVVDTTDTDAAPGNFYLVEDGINFFAGVGTGVAGAIILSREGNNGEHLRTSASLVYATAYPDASLKADAKEKAVRSYMAAGTTTDWPQEPIED